MIKMNSETIRLLDDGEELPMEERIIRTPKNRMIQDNKNENQSKGDKYETLNRRF